MSKGTLQIHTENILPIIKKWLYSEKDIFVRELVSNACDAIQKLRFLRDRNETTAIDEEFRIEIKIDKEANTLTFSDNGIGMDREEVEKYIAQVAFSGAEDFVNKYSSNNEKDQIIGHFGLGFYSSYMVAEKVELQTLSYKSDADPVFWSCDGSSSYEIETGSRTTRGTTITLFVDKENEEYLEQGELSKILKRYCSFLPYAIYLNDTHINPKEPLWIKAPSECTKEDYIDFFKHLYPFEEEPLFWVHLNVDYPFHLQGILYFTKWKKQFEVNKNNIHLYCNRVFVSDQCQDLIPDYLMMLKGVIDSPDIPLNVSRSSLQMDRTVRQLGSHISKKVSDKLSSLYKNDREKFIAAWDDIEIVTKLGAMQDDKFYKNVKDCLIWKNVINDWTTVEEYLERHKEEYKNKVFYTTDPQHQSHLIEMYRSKEIEVLCANDFIDSGVINLLEKEHSGLKFQRIDSALDDVLLDPTREKTLLDAEGKSESAKIADIIRKKMKQDTIEVTAKSLASDDIPGFIIFDEQSRRLRDYMSRVNPQIGMDTHKMMEKHTFVVNTNSPLIHAITDINATNENLARELTQHVYDLALLSQKELAPQQMQDFVLRSSHLLQELAKTASKKESS